jgi:hypothetical protein
VASRAIRSPASRLRNSFVDAATMRVESPAMAGFFMRGCDTIIYPSTLQT